jgi:hypothetical protein
MSHYSTILILINVNENLHERSLNFFVHVIYIRNYEIIIQNITFLYYTKTTIYLPHHLLNTTNNRSKINVFHNLSWDVTKLATELG